MRGNHDVLGLCPVQPQGEAVAERDDRLSGRPVGTRADGVDDAGDIPAEAIGAPLRRSREEAPGPGGDIGRVERGRLNLDPNLGQPGTGLSTSATSTTSGPPSER
jgi:hypothetical protein